jgi:hypothetical protein
MSEVLVGILLRGAQPPADSVLEAIGAISRSFRVTFTPEIRRAKILKRPAYWWIHELRPHAAGDHLRREMGRHRLGRLHQLPRVELERRIGDWWDAEYAAAGLYQVGEYFADERAAQEWLGRRPRGEELFGMPPMLAQLKRGQELFEQVARRAALENARDAGALAEIDEEVNDNPEFGEYVRDVAKDYYFAVSGGTLVSVNGTKGAHDDITDGQPLGQPGHGGAGERGERADGPAGEPGQGEVRTSGDGGGRAAEAG